MAANGKSMLIDTTKCFACRSCQVACKQWNELAAESPVPTNRGTYENPPDLSATQWLLIHFKETERADGSMAWNFARNSCRHCIDAPCKQVTNNADSITVDADTGAVLHNAGTESESFNAIRSACPFDIPRKDADGRSRKCRMCIDRITNGEVPSCAKACPSDAITFGDRDDILAMADARVTAVQGEFPNATVLDRDAVRLLILLGDPASSYKLQTAPA